MGSKLALPETAVTLQVDQIEELNKFLADLRHDINGDLALVVASAELIRLNPGALPRMLATLLDQPTRIRHRLEEFSAMFEKALGITRS